VAVVLRMVVSTDRARSLRDACPVGLDDGRMPSVLAGVQSWLAA
jgi:hypothetical protein